MAEKTVGMDTRDFNHNNAIGISGTWKPKGLVLSKNPGSKPSKQKELNPTLTRVQRREAKQR